MVEFYQIDKIRNRESEEGKRDKDQKGASQREEAEGAHEEYSG